MPAATSRPGRVLDEPAYVLHRYDWSESSLILEVFSRHHGRQALAAKGVKRPTSQFRPVLLPLQPLRLSWGGDAEVRTLKAAHWQGGHVMPTGDALLAGMYLNELLMRLLARDDPHPGVYDHYAQAVSHLAPPAHVSQAAVLRAFELLLLRDLGWLPSLAEEGGRLVPLDPAGDYRLHPEGGLQRVSHPQDIACGGRDWIELQKALDQPQPWPSLLPLCLADRGPLRQQLRQLLHYHSGVRAFQTRQLMVDVQQLVAL